MTEHRRRENNRDLVLRCLQAHRNVTNLQLNDICFRYGARILELRREGHDIRTHEKRGGIVTYSYHGRLALSQPSLFAQEAR